MACFASGRRQYQPDVDGDARPYKAAPAIGYYDLLRIIDEIKAVMVQKLINRGVLV